MVRTGSGQLSGARRGCETKALADLSGPRVARPGAEQDLLDTDNRTLCSVCLGGSHGRRLCLRDVRDPCRGRAFLAPASEPRDALAHALSFDEGLQAGRKPVAKFQTLTIP